MKYPVEIAEERLTKRLGPRPRTQPLVTAIMTGLAALAGTYLFRFLVIPDPDRSGWASLTVVAVAAVCGSPLRRTAGHQRR